MTKPPCPCPRPPPLPLPLQNREGKDRPIKNLRGMALEFVAGTVKRSPDRKSINCQFTFDMVLEFKNFKEAANSWLPDYLDHEENAIRPELLGLAYHNSFNYLAGQAGRINSSEALFKLFDNPRDYISEWWGSALKWCYRLPDFQIVEGKLRIFAGTYFEKWDGSNISIAELPLIPFEWALNVMEGHEKKSSDKPSSDSVAPGSVVTFMYMSEDKVLVDGSLMFRGTRYVRAWELGSENITPEQILIAQ